MTKFSDHKESFLDYFDQIEKIALVIKVEKDVEKLLWNVCGKVLEIFKCDRAWLLFPCDPDAPTWQVPIERAVPEFPGACSQNMTVDMTPDVAEIFQTALDSDMPIVYGPGGLPLAENTKSFGVTSQLSMAIYPRLGKPWQFGVHQCRSQRTWSAPEQKLFHIIGAMTGEALGNLLFFRDLEEAKEKLEQRVAERTEELQQKIKDLLTAEHARQALLEELQTAIAEIKTLRGILPICSFCKKIRTDEGLYEQVEEYIHKHSGVDFSHTVCPTCMKKHYPEFFKNN